MAMFYKAWRKWKGFIFLKASNLALAGGYKRLCSTSFVEEPSDVPCEGAICFTRSFDTKRVQLRKSLLCFMIACSLHQISLHRTRRTRRQVLISLFKWFRKALRPLYKYNYVTIGEGKYLSPCVLVRELESRKLGLLSL
ncbi:LOW QUALITY PROTEIN: hypothetical protein V1477_001394 [Vespula maculifrons]|uniref:Uncharacterized protein n=1 Tax=Vespula maculifrons TaxID=7453 RepID=A0ABD2D0B8_VESMC